MAKKQAEPGAGLVNASGRGTSDLLIVEEAEAAAGDGEAAEPRALGDGGGLGGVMELAGLQRHGGSGAPVLLRRAATRGAPPVYLKKERERDFSERMEQNGKEERRGKARAMATRPGA